MTAKERKERAKTIYQLKKSGMEVSEIKGFYRLSKAQIYNIIDKYKKALDKKLEIN